MGEGHIRRRGTAWQVIVAAGRDPVTGRKRQVSRTVHGSKRDAQAVRARLLVEVGEGRHGASDATVGELLERWLEAASPDWSPKNALETRRMVRRLLLPQFAAMPLRKLRTVDIDRFYADLRTAGGVAGQPLSPSSVRRVHVILRRALQQAVKWGWLPVNPAANATPPRVLRREISPPTPRQVARLLEVAEAEEPDLGMFLRLAAATGARRGELCALKWSDIDLVAGTVAIGRAIVDSVDGMIEKGTKTHSTRRVALDGDTVAALAKHRARQVERARACEIELRADGRVFSFDPDAATPWRPDGVTARFQRVRRHAGLEFVRLHDLRHYVATRLMAAGVPVRTVSGRLGHSNAATTLGVYAHFVEASDQDAAELLGQLLAKASAGDQEAR